MRTFAYLLTLLAALAIVTPLTGCPGNDEVQPDNNEVQPDDNDNDENDNDENHDDEPAS